MWLLTRVGELALPEGRCTGIWSESPEVLMKDSVLAGCINLLGEPVGYLLF